MKILLKVSLVLLSIILGLSFIYSSYTKAWPIESFEYRIVEYVQLPWLLSATAARALVGLEAALGVLIALNIFGKSKWVLKFSMLILVIFSIYLVYLWIAVGNDVNCGCFGDDILMTPSQSLIKNAVMLVLLFVLSKYHNGLKKRWLHILSIVGVLIGMAVPFVTQPIATAAPGFLKDEAYEMDLSVLYNEDQKDIPKIDVTKGKYVISYMSLTCPHCRKAAYKMHLMKQRNPDLPFFFVLNGKKKMLDNFWEDTKSNDIPYTMLAKDDFIRLSGPNVPAIYWIDNSTVEAKSTYLDLNQSSIEDWLKK